MKNLYKSILDNDKIDGHIHLFDHDGIIDSTLIDTSKRCVCFADIAFRYLDKYKNEEIIKYYDTFINNHYNPLKHILLATGTNAEEIIAIHKKYPQYIKGFGELKCYSEWKGGKLPYGNLEWIKPVMEYNRKFKMPVYIHYNLDSEKHRVEFENLIKKYQEMPIVLCHVGMVEDYDNNIIHNFVRELLYKYSNLYIDLSTIKTRDFYINYLEKLLELPYNRIIIGTDINPIISTVIDNPKEFSKNCYDQMYQLYNVGNFNNTISNLFKLTNHKSDKLIDLYRNKFSKFNRHCKVHLLTRGYLIGMFSKNIMKITLKHNAKTLSKVLNYFDNDINKLLNKFVLIGYTSDDRKKKIGELFKSVDNDYKKFLCIITILEMTYTFQRVGMLDLIDIDRIRNLIASNKSLIKKCIYEDKYIFKEKASTKYINSIFFIKNLSNSINELNNIISEDLLNKTIKYFLRLYENKPDATTLYGLTHILIGASDFYTKQIDDKYDCLVKSINQAICNSSIFNNSTLDLQIEMLLCSKLFSKYFINKNMDAYISFDNLEENEHTNMLYILLNKYDIND
jgi:hypothetical protein